MLYPEVLQSEDNKAFLKSTNLKKGDRGEIKTS
jgi:hypothetical protein